MKRCTKCILPENYPNIQFNTDGVCNFCVDYRSPEYKGEEAFGKLLESSRKKNAAFDVLIPWSGGRDSTYVLYNMVKKYSVRVLAYNYDNGFASEQAKENIERIANALGVHVVQERMDDHVHEKYLKELIHLNVGKTLEHMMLSLCSICRSGIWGGAYRVARENRIPMIVFGESKMESGYAKKVLEKGTRRKKLEKASSLFRKPVNFIKRRHYLRKFLKRFPPVTERSDIVSINYFDYLPWDEERMIKEIFEALRWKYGEGQDVWRFDCMIHALITHLNYALLGFSEKEELLSKMINEGMISRALALKRIQKSKEDLLQEREIIEDVFRRLDLDDKSRQYILEGAEERRKRRKA